MRRRLGSVGGEGATAAVVELEEGNGVLQLRGLAVQFLGGGGQLFGAGGVLLGGLVQLPHGVVDLVDAAGLLDRGRVDFLNQIGGLDDPEGGRTSSDPATFNDQY